MLHGHLPILISRLGAVMRHATDLYHSATRMIELGFYSIQTRPKIRGYTVISSILIRDPVARIRSIYAFERQQATVSPGAQKAKELDFKGYVEWRLSNSPVMFCNSQVHFCSRTKESVSDQI